MMNTTRHATDRAAFTLVELLVVIAIIGILAAILIPTLASAIRYSRESAIGFELNQLEMAMEEYKLKSGLSYPPDFTTGFSVTGTLIPPIITSPTGNLTARVSAHVRNISNKHIPTDVTAFLLGIDQDNDLSNGLTPIITPDEALVFWLRQTRTSVQYPLTGDGTYDNPMAVPFDNIRDTARQFFEFNAARLVDFDGDGYMSYVPPYGTRVPYVYFHNSTYLTAQFDPNDLNNDSTQSGATGDFIPNSAGVALPYAERVSASSATDVVDFYNQDGFQIICAGYDGNYGLLQNYATVAGTVTVLPNNIKVVPTRQNPGGQNISRGDRDNFANVIDVRLDKEMEN